MTDARHGCPCCEYSRHVDVDVEELCETVMHAGWRRLLEEGDPDEKMAASQAVRYEFLRLLDEPEAPSRQRMQFEYPETYAFIGVNVFEFLLATLAALLDGLADDDDEDQSVQDQGLPMTPDASRAASAAYLQTVLCQNTTPELSASIAGCLGALLHAVVDTTSTKTTFAAVVSAHPEVKRVLFHLRNWAMLMLAARPLSPRPVSSSPSPVPATLQDVLANVTDEATTTEEFLDVLAISRTSAISGFIVEDPPLSEDMLAISAEMHRESAEMHCRERERERAEVLDDSGDEFSLLLDAACARSAERHTERERARAELANIAANIAARLADEPRQE